LTDFLETEHDRLKNKFGKDVGRVDINGKIYSNDICPIEIGFIDNDGFIYDTRKICIEKVGQVDKEGKVS
jgi:hypothetical protein